MITFTKKTKQILGSLLIPAIALAFVTACSSPDADFEKQVEEYIQKFPYQDTNDYVVKYTGGDASKINTWIVGAEPVLVKAGEDKINRMNNDTIYKMAFVSLEDGPVVISSSAPTKDRFNSFQLMDDHNVNYKNIFHPAGEYTLYHGQKPENIRGTAIEVPSALSVVIVRVEVKDKHNSQDMAGAAENFNGITIEGKQPKALPSVDLLSEFSEEVSDEANRRMDEAFKTTSFSKTVVGPEMELGRDVPYLAHSAGSKLGWGGPDTSHSTYEALFFDAEGAELDGKKGTYVVTTEEPEVDAFWSLTVYDTERGGHFHPNKEDKYHINNTTAVKNDDGTISFMFKQSCTTEDMNCLEVPAGKFDIVARYYLPSMEIQTGEWILPGITLKK
jgi:hypothetical protein